MESGIDSLISAIEDNLATQVYAESLPLVGDNFKAAWDNNVTGFRFLTTIRTQLVTGLAGFNGQPDYDPATVATAIKNRLTTFGGFPTTITVVASTNNNEAQLAFSITRSYAAADVAIEPNVGLPNLDLQLSGTPIARTTVSPALTFSIGVDGDGLYFQTAGSTLQLNTTTTISALNVPGTFAGLPYTVTRNATNLTSVPANFTVTLKEPGVDGKLRAGELAGSPDLVDATLTGNTKISLKLDSSFPASAMVPRAGSDLVVLWNFAGHPVDPADNNQAFGGSATLSLDNNRVNLDSFFNSFAGEVLDEIESVTAPMGEVIDKLTYPIPLLSDLGSDEVTILDMLGADESTVAAIGGLDALVDLAALASSFTVNPATAVDLGSFSFTGGDLRVDPLADLAGSVTRGPNAQPSQLVTFMGDVNGIPGLTFPLLSDPTVVIGVLVGRDATLFAYQSEEAELHFEFQQFYPVMGPLGITLGGDVGLKTRFGFGYDTRGIIEYQTGGGNDLASLLNGFYAAAALDENGIPITGITLSASIMAGIELNVLVASAGVEGDITATVGFYLNDLAGDELGRIRGSVFSNQPIDEWIFAMGSLSAGLHAYLEIGWPPFGISFDFDSPRVTLLNYDSRDQTQPVLAEYDLLNPGDLILNVGERAPMRLYGNLDDGAEEFEISTDSGELIVGAFGRENTFSSATRIVGNGNERGDILAVAEDFLTPVDFSGGNGADVLRGGAGNDELSGGNGPDTLNGRSGNDLLEGGDDNDELIAGDGSDTLDGGDGLDAASWMGASIPVVIDLRTGSFTGAAAGDTMISIERYKGTGLNDILDGSDSPDSLLHGLGGDDILRGHKGEDLLEGGSGNDQLEGGPDNDMLIGGTGADQLNGGDGIDIASYLGAQAPVTVSLLTGTGTRGDADGDTLANIEVLMGSGLPKEPGPGFASGDVLEAGTGDAIIYGMDGSDEIRGGAGNDFLYGNHPDIPGIFKPGFDDDDITGGAGNDQLFGQTGDDELDGGEGADTLLGGPGDDHLITFDTAGIDALNGEEGINRLSADYSDKVTPLEFTVGVENEFIYPDNDRFEKFHTLGTLRTGSGNDVIRLAAQQEHAFWNKNIDGGAGDDWVIADWRGFYPTGGGGSSRTSDIVAGGDGVDTLSFEQSAVGVSVNLSTNVVGGAATGMTISGFENVVGTNSTDTLTGDAGNNVIMPLLGGPDLTLSTRNDSVNGGAGMDTLRVDYSTDPRVNAQGISMTPNAVSGSEPIALGTAWDVGSTQVVLYYLGIERFEITGGDGPDKLYGEGVSWSGWGYDWYQDRLIGRGGNDLLAGVLGDDYLDGGDGNDTLLAGGGHDTVLGGAGNDTITFVFGDNLISAYGTDFADAGPGNDIVTNIRSPGSDSTSANASTVMRFDGGDGIDTLSADLGHMTSALVFDEAAPVSFDLPNGGYIHNFERFRDVTTGSGNDVIILHGRNNDRIVLRAGNDTLNPGLGVDDPNGGAGDDLLILDYSLGDDADTSGLVQVGSTSIYERRSLSTGALLDQYTGSGFERLIFTGGSKNDAFLGFSGNDRMAGGAGNDTLTGASGDDWIEGGTGNDTLNGGQGNDWLDGGPGADTFRGDQSNDTFIVDDPGDLVIETTSNGSDTVRSSISYTLPTNVEHLVLTGSASEATGNGSGNTITGNSRNNILSGLAGNDTLSGGGGASEIDHLIGGLGLDTFVLGVGGDRYYDDGNPATPGLGGYAVIEDFTPSESDRLRLAGAAGEYLLGDSPFPEIVGTALYHDSDHDAVLDPDLDELIAIIQSPVALNTANTLTTGTYNSPVDPALVGLDAPLAATLVEEPEAQRLTIDFVMNATIPANVVMEIQTSRDLGETDPWLTISSKTGAGAWGGLSPAVSTDAGNGKVTVHAAALQTTSSAPKLFIRARVSGQ